MMYTDNSSQNLNMSTSVPLFRPNSYGRASYPDLQHNNSFSGSNGQNKPGTLQQNPYKMKEGKTSENIPQQKKIEMPLNLFSSQNLNNMADNKKYAVTHSQLQGEANQTYRFQFKRNTQNPNKMSMKQDTSRNNQVSQDASNVLSYMGPAGNQEGQGSQKSIESNAEGKAKVIELEKKVKDLESQLKFQQKYANDLYKTSQEAKKETNKLKEENNKYQQQFLALQGAKEQLLKDLKAVEEIYRRKKEENELLKKDIQQKRERITSLQESQISRDSQILKLKEKIENFNSLYRNELYEQRIRKLNEELCSVNGQLAQAIIDKNIIGEELKFKNEKILYLNLESPTKSKTAGINVTGKSNEIINNAFEESIKLYQKDIKELKEIIQTQNEEHRKLREELVEQRKEKETLQEEIKINNLRFNTERKNLQLDKQSKLIEKSNEISSLSNRLKMVEERYAKSLREIEEKDRFLQEHLVGRTKDLETKQYIEQTMREYRDTFESRFSLEERLRALQQESKKNSHD